jgi:hypothetical protein
VAIIERCPRCQLDKLVLHHDFDGDETGTWPIHYYECNACHQYVHAANIHGDYLPVNEEED